MASEVQFSMPSVAARSPLAAPMDYAEIYRFRGFQVEVRNRVLCLDGVAVSIGGRAFDLLIALLRARGKVASKRQIMEEVWPSTIVDDSNLRFQMACLRRVLCPHGDLIKTIQGRGYLFVAEAVSVGGELPPMMRFVPPAGTPVASHRNGAATVAIVEDDANTREALDGLLRSSGYLVDTYPSAPAFMEARGSDKADCLILDVWLPGRSGLDFQADLRASGADLPIVFISGHADVSMSVRAMKGGAIEFLTKPVRHQELLEAIESAVLMRRASAGLSSSINP